MRRSFGWNSTPEKVLNERRRSRQISGEMIAPYFGTGSSHLLECPYCTLRRDSSVHYSSTEYIKWLVMVWKTWTRPCSNQINLRWVRIWPLNVEPTYNLKGIWYGRDPEVIYLQLTNFQSFMGISIHCIVFWGDPKSHLPCSREDEISDLPKKLYNEYLCP